MLKILLGLVVPYVGVLGLLPWVARVSTTFLNIPFVYLWMFAWFFLTSGCLYLCFRIFDAKSEAQSHTGS